MLRGFFKGLFGKSTPDAKACETNAEEAMIESGLNVLGAIESYKDAAVKHGHIMAVIDASRQKMNDAKDKALTDIQKALT